MNPVILSVPCKEPNGVVIRNVRLTELSFEKVKFLINKLSDIDVLFNDYVKKDPKAILEHFLSVQDGEIRPTGLLWDVDDVGIFLLNEIRPPVSGDAHFVFWDKRFKGREALCREMLRYIMREYSLHRIQVEVPVYATHTIKAVNRIGMVLEGRSREAVRYKDGWFDINRYSVLEEDLNIPISTTDDPPARIACPNCKDIYRKQFHIRKEA